MGAALTMLSGIEFQLLGYDPLVVTYGGPKVGNQEFADFTDKLFDTEEVHNEITSSNDFSRGFIRVVHRHDIIPLLPPMFSHAGYEYFIDKRDLPHEECDLDRRGMEYSGIFKRALTIKPSTLWPDKLGSMNIHIILEESLVVETTINTFCPTFHLYCKLCSGIFRVLLPFPIHTHLISSIVPNLSRLVD